MGKLFTDTNGVEFFTPLDNSMPLINIDNSNVIKLIPGTIRKITNKDPKPLEIFSVINNSDFYKILQPNIANKSNTENAANQTATKDMLRIQKLASPYGGST